MSAEIMDNIYKRGFAAGQKLAEGKPVYFALSLPDILSENNFSVEIKFDTFCVGIVRGAQSVYTDVDVYTGF